MLAYLIVAIILAARNLVKTVSGGLAYLTWNLLFDYPVGDVTEPIYSNQYVEVSVNADDVLHVTQKTGEVEALVHANSAFILLKICRNGHSYVEVPRGFSEDSDANGFDVAAREVSEELRINPADYGAHYRCLGIVMSDSNLLTTDIVVVDVALDRLPQFPEIELQVDEGIEGYQVKSLAVLQG